MIFHSKSDQNMYLSVDCSVRSPRRGLEIGLPIGRTPEVPDISRKPPSANVSRTVKAYHRNGQSIKVHKTEADMDTHNQWCSHEIYWGCTKCRTFVFVFFFIIIIFFHGSPWEGSGREDIIKSTEKIYGFFKSWQLTPTHVCILIFIDRVRYSITTSLRKRWI